MKLFWGSIVVICFACFAPLAYGQGSTTYVNSQNNGSLNTNQSWDQSGSWSNGVPSGAANTGSYAYIYPRGVYLFNGVLTTPNPVVVISVSAGQSAQGMDIYGFTTTSYPLQLPGTINLNIATGATLTLTGNNVAGTPPVVLDVFNGITANINGGSLSLPSSADFLIGDTLAPTLNFSGVNVTIGDGSAMFVGTNFFGATGAQGGTVNEINGATVTAGNNYQLTIGSPTSGSSGAYSLAGNSSLTMASNGYIYIANGSFSQDSTSSVNLGANSGIYAGYFSTDVAQYNQAGNITLNNGFIDVGDQAGSVGVFQQTGGNTTGTGALTIGTGGGQGTYTITGGSADFELGIAVGGGAGAGTGTLNQSGNTTLTSGASNLVTVGVGGTGVYNFSGGTANFQGGMQVGTLGTVNQVETAPLRWEMLPRIPRSTVPIIFRAVRPIFREASWSRRAQHSTIPAAI